GHDPLIRLPGFGGGAHKARGSPNPTLRVPNTSCAGVINQQDSVRPANQLSRQEKENSMKRDRLMVLVLASLISLSVIALLGLNASSSGRAEEGAPILEYPEFPPTPTIGPQPAARPNPAGVLLASENFDSPDALARWEIVDPAGLLPE